MCKQNTLKGQLCLDYPLQGGSIDRQGTLINSQTVMLANRFRGLVLGVVAIVAGNSSPASMVYNRERESDFMTPLYPLPLQCVSFLSEPL